MAKEGDWQKVNQTALDDVNRNIEWYEEHAHKAMLAYYWCIGIGISAGVLAPLCVFGAATTEVATNGPPLAIFGFSPEFIAGLALFLAIISGLAESVQRFKKFERNRAAYFSSKLALRHLKRVYSARQARVPGGSDAWWRNFDVFQAEYHAIISAETEKYFEALFDRGRGPQLPEG